MIVTARHVSDSNVGSSGHFVDNVILKLPRESNSRPFLVNIASTVIELLSKYPIVIVFCYKYKII